MGTKQKSKHKRRISIRVVILFAAPLIIFLFWYFSLSAPMLPTPPLRDLATMHSVRLGSHVSLSRLKDRVYPDIVTSQFSFMVIDGEAHWATLRPSSTQYNYADTDKLVAYAAAHNQSVQMHHLVWGEQNRLPAWLKNGHLDKVGLLSVLHEDITNVMSHYRGKVAEWTVVNEAFTRAQHIYGLHDWWADNMGDTSYIDSSFLWARQADPSAKLILNDFGNEVENSISNAEYSYIKDAKSRTIPIDGMGMQMHINAAKPPSKDAVIKNMQRFAAIGTPVYVTEFDVNVNTVKGSAAYKTKLEAQITYNMVRACIESKACVNFSEFGISDKENLLKQLGRTDSHSYLFDSRYRPKPSFYSFRQAWLEP